MATDLFSTMTVGGLGEIKNRVIMAPLTRARAGPSRVPNDIMKDYYVQRASAGLIIAEATAVSEQAYGWYGAPGLYTEEHALEWKKIVDAVHEKGGKIVMQLWHMGRQGHPTFNDKNEIVAPSAIQIAGDGHVRNADFETVGFALPRALETDEIPALVESYKKSAELAKMAGFDGVEIHSANGYLLDTFLQSSTNKRTDNYGGSMENRVRLLKEIIEAIGEVYALNQIGVRLSPNGVFGGVGSDDNHLMFPFVAKQLDQYGLAYLHVMDGLGFGFHGKCPVVTLYDLRKNFSGPMMGNVGYTKESAEGAIRTGVVDMIAFGRLYLSNPDLVERFKNDWSLNPIPSDTSTWWSPGPELEKRKIGYADYETYTPTEEAK